MEELAGAEPEVVEAAAAKVEEMTGAVEKIDVLAVPSST